jgi:glycogen debranching enzyme
MEPVAEALGHTAVAEEMRQVARRARSSVRSRFRTGGEYALGLHADGSPQLHRTVMLSVPLLLGLVPPADAEPWFDAVAGPAFSAPWGVRMIAADDPLFDPGGYHLGAVWPLYTGWVSLAEWRGGRWAAALSHLSANARLIGVGAKGAFDEVLHGTDAATPAGICPDQAWSAAMVLLPAIEGLWGVTPDALNSAVRVAPFLPTEWDRMAVRRLKIGRTTLDIEIQRRPGRLVIRVDRAHGPRIHLVLEPRGLPPVTAVTLDEQPLGAGRAVFEVGGRHEAVFCYESL